MWLLTISDYHNKQLFTQVNEINESTLEVQCLNSNFAIAMKWARAHISHIRRILFIQDIEYVFNDEQIQKDSVEEWETPLPPDIKFYQNPYKASIPKTISQRTKFPKLNQDKQLLDIDNQTVATVNTAWSSSQNETSDLHSDSRQQLSITHEYRMNQLESLLTNNFQEMQEQYDNIKNKIQLIKRSNEYLQQEMGTIIHTLPQLSTNINSQQAQLIQSINENTEFCKITSNHITQLQSYHTMTDVRIYQLQEIV
jgi:hypothetical protein